MVRVGADDRRHQEEVFLDRREAGVRLAGALTACRGRGAHVLGIPRGGVPVAAEVARHLDADLDIVVARKIGAPRSPELALGAVAADGSRWLNAALIVDLGVPEHYLAAQTAAQLAEARRRDTRLRGGLPRRSWTGRPVIVVDDGLATGATMHAAIAAVRRQGPARLIVAVPVGAREACAALRPEVDGLVCLYEPEPFWAVGLYYREFAPTADDEVRELLRAHAAARDAARAPAD